MPTHHDPIELVAGDDWEIPGALLDDNGNPLDLSDAEFAWVVVDTGGIADIRAHGKAPAQG